MVTRMQCLVPLFDRHAPRRIISVHDERSRVTAQALDWPGTVFEAGRNNVAEVDDLTLAHHYFGLNTDRRPVTLELKEPRGYRPVRLDPGSGWLVPAGEPFSIRVRDPGSHEYIRISIDPVRLDRLVGAGEGDRPVWLRRTFGIGGPHVRHLLDMLSVEAANGTPSGLAFVDSVTMALGHQLVHHAGIASGRPEPTRGGLAPAARRRVLELMDERPDARLTIDALAREAGLSPGHFARAFKESVGRSPHQHLLALRLERARRLLDDPESALSNVAFQTGFADQAHLTRLFKRRFGVTPGSLQRSRRR